MRLRRLFGRFLQLIQNPIAEVAKSHQSYTGIEIGVADNPDSGGSSNLVEHVIDSRVSYYL
jgi:hypothetical protein